MLLHDIVRMNITSIKEYKFVGNGTAYILLGTQILLGNAHYIEFEAIPYNGTAAIIGINASVTDVVLFRSGTIGYRPSDGVEIKFNIPTLYDGNYHVFKFLRLANTIELFVDGISQGTPKATSGTMSINNIFALNNSVAIFPNNAKYVDLNGNKFTFSPPSTVNSSGGSIATIVNDDGNRIQEV